MEARDLSKEIERYNKIQERVIKKRELCQDEGMVLSLEEERYRLIYSQIHGYLAPKREEWAEEEILNILRVVVSNDLVISKSKGIYFKESAEYYRKRGDREKLGKSIEYLDKWLELYENFYALVAFRSAEYFANFMEWETRDKDKVWKYSIDPNNDGGKTGVNYPFFYYFTQMVLNDKIRFLSKQQPTGTGKSYGNVVAISWLFGVDSEADILLVLGNPALVSSNCVGIVNMMTSPRYAKVFPEYKQFEADVDEVELMKNPDMAIPLDRNKVFEICRIKDGTLKLSFSSRPMSITIIAKDTPIDGIRVKYLFLDDICRSKDAGNNSQHQKDIDNYWNSWWKRNYNPDDLRVVIGGTTYSIYDILSNLKNYYSGGRVERSPINKYTTLSMDGKSVFVCVPALDYDTDESTYPQKYSTKSKREMRDRDFRSFMAMEQQQPLPPDTTPFYWDNLRLYSVIPEENRSSSCWASIDPVRIGNDNFAMPIFAPVGDLFYLKDCLYEQRPQETLYSLVVDKIIQHHITQLVIERNTDTSLKALIEKLLDERGISFCNIIESYTNEKKDVRITNEENNIKTRLVFPEKRLYANSSAMGKFMYDLVSFSWKLSENAHDDSIDACTKFSETFIRGRNRQAKMVGTFKR